MTETKGSRFLRYIPLLLDALRSSAPAPMRPAEAFKWIRNTTDVPEEDLNRTISGGGQTIFENQVHWARFYLAKAGLISSPKHGLWGLTPAGEEAHLTPETTWDLYVRVRDANRPSSADESSTPAPEGDGADDGPAYWFGGAIWGGADDQTERFSEEGIWSNGVDDHYNDLVARMKPVDRIAIKSTFVRKLNLPFDVGGKPASCMRIKATGTITGHGNDPRTVEVDWDPPAEPRDWFFYTYRTTLVETDADHEMGARLIDFAFNGAPQDYPWFLEQPYWASKYFKSLPKRSGPADTDTSDDETETIDETPT